MTTEDEERLEELEEMLERGDIDKEDTPDEWEELKELREARQYERRQKRNEKAEAEALRKWEKAGTAIRVRYYHKRLRQGVTLDSHHENGNREEDWQITGVEDFYTLTQEEAQRALKDMQAPIEEFTIEAVDRKSLPDGILFETSTKQYYYPEEED